MNGTVIEIFLTYESIDEDPACAGTALEMALVRTLRQRARPPLCHSCATHCHCSSATTHFFPINQARQMTHGQ
jgi:hypothetical protein